LYIKSNSFIQRLMKPYF